MKLRSVFLGVALTAVAGLALAAPPARPVAHHAQHRTHHRHHAHKAAVHKATAPAPADAHQG